MTTNTFIGAIYLCNTTPDPATANAMARDIADIQFPELAYDHYITDTLPESTPVDSYDQFTARMRDLPAGAVYLVVVPAE